MCHFRDDTIEATELERELREEYTVHFEDESETADEAEATVLFDGGEA